MSNLKISLDFEDLSVRRKHSLLCLMYTQSMQCVNIYDNNMNMSLCSSKKVKLRSDFTRATKIQCSHYYRGLNVWNSLPESIQKENNTSRFKTYVKLLFNINVHHKNLMWQSIINTYNVINCEDNSVSVDYVSTNKFLSFHDIINK